MMTKMVICSNCGKETSNKVICEHCGLTIDKVDNDKPTKEKISIIRQLWLKIFVYLFTTSAFDIISLSVILIEYESSQNGDMTIVNGIAFLLVIIQTVLFYWIIYPSLDLLQREDQLFYAIIPTIHFLIILLLISILNNYSSLLLTFGYIVAWSFIAGLVHVYFRVRVIYDSIGLSGSTPEEILEKNKEKQKRNYQKTLNVMDTAEFRNEF